MIMMKMIMVMTKLTMTMRKMMTMMREEVLGGALPGVAAPTVAPMTKPAQARQHHHHHHLANTIIIIIVIITIFLFIIWIMKTCHQQDENGFAVDEEGCLKGLLLRGVV